MMRRNRYYVDKTAFIKSVVTDGAFVQVITRPRRFGKTLFMDTLRTFLAINPEKPGDVATQIFLRSLPVSAVEFRIFSRMQRPAMVMPT